MKIMNAFFLIFLLLFSATAGAFSPICSEFLLPPVEKIKLEDIHELNIATYNVLNLNESVGKYETINGVRTFVPGKRDKPLWQRQQIAAAIKESKLDIVVMEEVEGAHALSQFNSEFLDDVYYPICIQGNDERGIQIGFLIKKNLPFHIQVDSYKDLTWPNPLQGNKVEKLFSRDLPVMSIHLSDKSPRGPPDMVLIGTHYKSQRGSGTIDPTSKVKREAQATGTAEIIKELQQKYPNTPILLAGDFNNDINSAEFSHLRENGFLDEALSFKNVPQEDRITHTFHPHNGPTKYSQLDAIMFTPNFRPFVKKAEVYRYKDANGAVKPIPKTYAERDQNPSDHFMMKMTVDFDQFLRK